jgi:hypothetical protein
MWADTHSVANPSWQDRPGECLALLKDVSFPQPGKLNYTLAGQTQNVNHLLLQKSNGTFYLAIWLAVQSADPDNPSTAYNVPPQNLTLSTNTQIAGSIACVLDDSGNLTSSSTELRMDLSPSSSPIG